MNDQNPTEDARTADLHSRLEKTPNHSAEESAAKLALLDSSVMGSPVTWQMTPGDAEELVMASRRIAGVTGLGVNSSMTALKEVLEWDHKLKAHFEDEAKLGYATTLELIEELLARFGFTAAENPHESDFYEALRKAHTNLPSTRLSYRKVD